MLNIKIENDGRKVYLTAPFVPGFSADAKNAGGRWDGSRKAWAFDASQEERVRELAREWWGTDGADEFASDLVTVKMLVGEANVDGQYGGVELWKFGRKIASRAGRDAPVILGPDVVLISGGFDSQAGSVKYPRLGAEENTWVEVLNVPRNAVPDHEHYQIVGTSVDHEALKTERTRLVARLDEIDRLLKS